MERMDLTLGLADTHVLITGAAGYIGRVVVHAFLSANAFVTAVDISLNGLNELVQHLGSPTRLQLVRADMADEDSVELAFQDSLINAHHEKGRPICVVALAGLDLSVLSKSGVVDRSFDDWKRVIDVNVNGTFLTARAWLGQVRKAILELKNHGASSLSLHNCSLIIVGSESGHWGERECAEYATSKSAIMGGLLQSMKAEAPRVCQNARVNAIAPGPVDTARFKEECRQDPSQFYVDSQATTALGKPVPPEAVAKAIIFLASESWSGYIHGQTLNVDSGKLGKLMWTEGEREA